MIQPYHCFTGLSRDDVNVVELHDCFSCNELITYEALGLCQPGKTDLSSLIYSTCTVLTKVAKVNSNFPVFLCPIFPQKVDFRCNYTPRRSMGI